MNAIFAFDIVLNFFQAYLDQDFTLIDDRKEIAFHYLTSWFVVDFISVIPFDAFIDKGNVNKLARFTRIGKVYKLVRLTKLARLIKIAKAQSQFMKHVAEILKIGSGFERMVTLLLTFFILQHVTACLWIFFGKINDLDKNNWIYQKNY